MPDLREDQHPKLWNLLFNGDREQRLSALNLLSKVDVEWPVSWIALLLADTDSSVSGAAYQALRARGRAGLPLLSLQRVSPLQKIRKSVVRLIGEFGTLDDLHDLIPALFDAAVDVREEGKKAIESVIARALVKTSDRDSPDRRIEETMRLFAALSTVSQLNVRAVLVSCFLSLSIRNPRVFWELFPKMEIRARNAIEHEILASPSRKRIELLYFSFSSEDETLGERALMLIERLLNKDTVGDHVASLVRLSPKDRDRALKLLAEKGTVGTFFEYFAWIPRNQRVFFLQLFTEDFGERFSQYLLNLLNEANPQLVPVLIDNFLTFKRDLPLEVLRTLLENSSPIVVRSAIRYLFYRGTQECVPSLLALVGSDDPHTARAAWKAVSRISRDFLLDHYSDLSPAQRTAMVKTLAKADEGFVDGIVRLLEGMDDEDRLHLTRILSEIADHPAAERALNDLMDDPNDKVRAAAVRGLEKMDLAQMSPEQIDALLADPDPRVRANVIESLPLDEKRRHIDRIRTAAVSEVPRERANAVIALAELEDPDYELRLMQMLRHPDSWMRASGLWALSQLNCPHLVEKALELCSDKAPHVRVHALRVIARKGTPELARQVTPWLSDPSSDVREAARQAIENHLGLDYKV